MRSGVSIVTTTNQITATALVYSSNLVHQFRVNKFFTAGSAYLYLSGYVQHSIG